MSLKNSSEYENLANSLQQLRGVSEDTFLSLLQTNAMLIAS